MFNLILTILLLPFTPAWFYGDIGNAIPAKDNLAVSLDSEACRFDQSGGEKKGDGQQGEEYQNVNIFPTDRAMASGFIPTKTGTAPDLRLWAGSSVAIDVDSGTILHYENGRKKTQIASLTKVMTAILVAEKISDLEKEEVVIPREVLLLPGTSVGCPTSVFCNANRMYAGEKVWAIDLMKAMLMNSANDAATALGIHIAGSSDKFVDMMNDKAKAMGLKDTHFCTPSGLEIDGHEDECYSSAYDIARIAAASMKYDVIWEIMQIPDGQFYSTNGRYMHELKNTDILLGDIPNCLGGKTGFTPMAGKSLLLGAVDPTGKHKIIAVVLNDEQRWDDMRLLVNWVFDNYDWK